MPRTGFKNLTSADMDNLAEKIAQYFCPQIWLTGEFQVGDLFVQEFSSFVFGGEPGDHS